MLARLIATSALLLGSFQISAAGDVGLMVAMEVQRDGQVLARPSIWQPSGTTGEISMENEFRLQVTPTVTDDKADVKFEIFMTQDGVESKVGSPRIITKFGDSASIAWNSSDGQSYSVSLRVSETAKPIK